MELLSNSLLPRRLTQIYIDTKKRYEQIVQQNITNPQLSSLDLKLRIQKDRLIAWGLEWADSNDNQTNDIDNSLDRAGISDLVASIMSNIEKLLHEAEQIQSQSRAQLPGAYPNDKAGMLSSPVPQWTPSNLARLEDITKNITTSIDTLCDLSRSQQFIRQGHHRSEKPLYADSKKASVDSPSALLKKPLHDPQRLMRSQSNFISSKRIDPANLIYPTKTEMPTMMPPSYNSTATDPGNRVFAWLIGSDETEKPAQLVNQRYDKPVFVDYYSEDGSSPRNGPLPSLQRFEDLVLSLQGLHSESETLYTGCFKILGWLAEPHNSRNAFVYEITQPSLIQMSLSLDAVNSPQSLLFYLQHSGDTDSSNVPCLEDRFRLALNLVSTLLHVHAKGLTHRNVNSNNILFLNESVALGKHSKPWKEGVIRKPFLVSWDQCAEDTSAQEPETLISNIYRPPGIERGQRSLYRPVHDIYSLGLILLEIGLWMPLIKLWKTKYTRSDFKARLQAIYSERLAAKCGKSYMNAVRFCLCAGDEDHASGVQHSTVQNDYYWSVLKPLERCAAIDSSEEPRVLPAASASVIRHELPDTETESNSHIHHPSHSFALPATALSLNSSESPEWMTRKGYSPKHPKGIDLPVWSYEIDERLENYFNTVMAPKICYMANKNINKRESIELSVCMTGPSRNEAKPTLLMVCRSVPLAWKILSHVNQEKQMFDVYVERGRLRRSKAKKKKGKKIRQRDEGKDKPGQYPSRYQQKPSCGASIGCFVDEQHSEAVTFGGIVLVDGETHGMSVHHMLEDADIDAGTCELEESMEDDMSDATIAFDDFSTDTSDLLKDLEKLPDGFDASEIWDAESECRGTRSGTERLSTKPGQGGPIIVTQPALDDVDPNYFPSEDEMSDDHLVIHGLGTIHASSGLRRLSHEGVAHEIDWALFKIHDDRRPTVNTVIGGAKHCEKATQDFFPTKLIKASALGDLKVHAFGSTSGLETGRIRPKMELTRMPGRLSWSPVWKFVGKFGVAGDSGAWIIDNETGGLCGHVSSYSDSQQYGVLAPMEAQLQDMEETLSVKVALPTGEENVPQSFRDQILKESSDIKPIPCSDNDSGTEDDGSGSEKGTTPPESPELATSPPTSPPKSGPETLSLNSVAEKWECTQASKRNSMDRSSKDEKGVQGSVKVCKVREEAVKASC